MCEVNVHGVSASRSAKREKYVGFCNCNIVDDDGTEWMHPFRCRQDIDDVSVCFPKSLKELTKERLNMHAQNNIVPNSPVGAAVGNIGNGRINGVCVTYLKKSHQFNKETDSLNKTLVDTIKVEISEQLENDSGSDSIEEQETFLETDNLHVAQLSPHASTMSESQMSCNSYHTANSIETENEISEELDEDVEETFFDAWDILNTPRFFKNLSNDFYSRTGEHQASVGFTPSSFHNKSNHEIQVEDADTGVGHVILSGTHLGPSVSVSLDELLETASESSIQTGSKFVEMQGFTLSGKKQDNLYTSSGRAPNNLESLKSNVESKEDEVVTTLSTVDITALQCPETEILPFSQSRSDCLDLFYV